MKKKGMISLTDDKLYLTKKGKQQYLKAISQEIDRISKNERKYKDWKPPSRVSKIAWKLLGIITPIILILLIIYIGPIIYDFIINLLE